MSADSIILTDFTPAHYDRAYALWAACEGVALSAADSPCAISSYLARNPGLSLVAEENGTLVGTLLCGHDGRRGYIHHLAVAPSHRRKGIAARLAESALERLGKLGITKCHLFIFNSNESGKAFWTSQGWKERDDISILSFSAEKTEGCCC